MHSETWIEKAARLQRSLVRPGLATGVLENDDAAARERIKIALWLRREFSENQVSEPEILPVEGVHEP